MRALWLVLFGLVTMLVTACAKPEPPQVTPRALRIASVGSAGIELGVELDVHNPNSFALHVQSVDGALVLGDGQEFARGSAAPGRPIPPKESAMVASTISVPWTNLGLLMPFVASGQPVPYKFVGSARIGGARLNVNVPFELAGELGRAELLQIAMRGLAPPSASASP